MTTDNRASRKEPLILKTLLDVPRDQRDRMTREQTESFVRCSMMEQAETKTFSARELCDALANAPYAVRLLVERLAWADPKMPVRTPVILFLSTLCTSPGDCVLWAFYVAKRSAELRGPLTMDILAIEDFPWGFPNDEGRTEIWDAQKGFRHERKVDNLLDTREPWPEPAVAASPTEQEAAHG